MMPDSRSGRGWMRGLGNPLGPSGTRKHCFQGCGPVGLSLRLSSLSGQFVLFQTFTVQSQEWNSGVTGEHVLETQPTLGGPRSNPEAGAMLGYIFSISPMLGTPRRRQSWPFFPAREPALSRIAPVQCSQGAAQGEGCGCLTLAALPA